MSLCTVFDKNTVSTTDLKNYTINITILNTAAVVIVVVMVVNIDSRRQFFLNHCIKMFHCFDIFMYKLTKCDISRNSGDKTHII